MTQDEVDKYCESVLVNAQGLSNRKLKYGAGINDLPHITQFVDGCGKNRRHSGYSQWSALLTRCYDQNFKEKQPTYIGVTICYEWLKASNFVAWQKTQYRENDWQLDKDLLVVGNKIYCPETCVYVPQWLNTFTGDCGRARGDYLIGVTWNKRNCGFVAQCQNPITGEQEYLGYRDSELEAHLAWRKRKLEHALTLKPKMDDIDLRIYPNVVTIIENAR